MKAELQFDVEKLTREVVEVAMAEALSRNGGVIVKEVVRHALEEKASQYSKETVLQAALRKAIMTTAKERIRLWLVDHAVEIGALVDAAIRETLNMGIVRDNVLKAISDSALSIDWFKEEVEDE